LTGINYGKIKHISDWMITEEGLRTTLATVVNAISNLDITHKLGVKARPQAATVNASD
jgi:hypothetical protein